MCKPFCTTKVKFWRLWNRFLSGDMDYINYSSGSIHLLGPHGVHLILVLMRSSCSKDDSGADPVIFGHEHGSSFLHASHVEALRYCHKHENSVEKKWPHLACKVAKLHGCRSHWVRKRLCRSGSYWSSWAVDRLTAVSCDVMGWHHGELRVC